MVTQNLTEKLDQAKVEVKLRLWVVEHFRILPTDKRFKKLKWDQIELLFLNYISQPSDEQYRRLYLDSIEKEEIEDNLPKDKMEEMGYNPEEIAEITQILKDR